ncbi:protein spaetzle 4 [Drosophila busckii]|uniref:protein spaetzle 4 n=1 Tax=Drosophila busckii TaxID=30019 RepID=UPI00083F2B63|nr:protein spaetzle 4 [Drosophila busckii]
MSRRGRAQMLAAIPCDLSKQPFCHLPGNIYPWHAVRRFVHENQGLMKRMYGDVRHISILRDEIQNNEVDVDDIEDAAERYSKSPRGGKYMLHGRERDRDDFLSYKGNDVLMEPHFRPVTTTTTSTTTTSTKQKPSESVKAATPIGAAGKTASGTATATAATVAASNSTRRNVTRPALGSTTPISFASLFSGTSSIFNSDKLRRPLTSSSTTAPSPSSSSKAGLLRDSGQLFQDAIKQEPVAVASNLRGVNACPVKDEVVAPFWANNTRGEVLALLNLYPFEQYVHWEKCTHEFKQMFCRDGCRCEQQYRLHRLLAYDPHNECRGIFSDWFRFPSSCICKCYNIPLDFRATSRSPRADTSFAAQGDPIVAAEAQVQRAIYKHATDQWYRPRDEFDLYEG